MTGLEAGLVIVTADDPAMHSSQNEQDNRRYAKFARVPCLEPSDSQEAKDLVGVALDLSEQFDTPVFLRLTTRICHSSTPVELGEQKAAPAREKFPRNPAKYVMVPGNARRKPPGDGGTDPAAGRFCRDLPSIGWRWGDTRRQLGIVTCGVAYQYAKEVFRMRHPASGDDLSAAAQMIRDFAARSTASSWSKNSIPSGRGN